MKGMPNRTMRMRAYDGNRGTTRTTGSVNRGCMTLI